MTTELERARQLVNQANELEAAKQRLPELEAQAQAEKTRQHWEEVEAQAAAKLPADIANEQKIAAERQAIIDSLVIDWTRLLESEARHRLAAAYATDTAKALGLARAILAGTYWPGETGHDVDVLRKEMVRPLGFVEIKGDEQRLELLLQALARTLKHFNY